MDKRHHDCSLPIYMFYDTANRYIPELISSRMARFFRIRFPLQLALRRSIAYDIQSYCFWTFSFYWYIINNASSNYIHRKACESIQDRLSALAFQIIKMLPRAISFEKVLKPLDFVNLGKGSSPRDLANGIVLDGILVVGLFFHHACHHVLVAGLFLFLLFRWCICRGRRSGFGHRRCLCDGNFRGNCFGRCRGGGCGLHGSCLHDQRSGLFNNLRAHFGRGRRHNCRGYGRLGFLHIFPTLGAKSTRGGISLGNSIQIEWNGNNLE